MLLHQVLEDHQQVQIEFTQIAHIPSHLPSALRPRFTDREPWYQPFDGQVTEQCQQQGIDQHLGRSKAEPAKQPDIEAGEADLHDAEHGAGKGHVMLATIERLPHRYPEATGKADTNQRKPRQQQMDIAPRLPTAEQ